MHLPPLTMDNAKYQRFQDEDAWSLDETSSCSSSFTFIESTISTKSMPSDPECRQYLSQLPRRLLLAITAHLDVVSRICLQSANRHFRQVIDVDRANLSVCARYALARRLRSISKSDYLSTCPLCKTSQCKVLFGADGLTYLEEPQHWATRWTMRALNMMPLIRQYATLELNKKQKPDLYACLMRRFTPDPEVEALMPFIRASTDEPVWIVLNVLRCQHCGKCVSEKDTRLEGCRDCKCDYCPRKPDCHFRRCGPGHSHRLRPRLIKQNAMDGGVDVVEDSWKGTITLPVHHPICRADGRYLRDNLIYYVNEARRVRRRDLRWTTVFSQRRIYR